MTVPRLRGFDDGVGTRPVSLRDLRRTLASALAGDDLTLVFLPPELPFTARHTTLRRLIRQTLALPCVGPLTSQLLYGVLLAVMPQDIAVATRRAA